MWSPSGLYNRSQQAVSAFIATFAATTAMDAKVSTLCTVCIQAHSCTVTQAPSLSHIQADQAKQPTSAVDRSSTGRSSLVGSLI